MHLVIMIALGIALAPLLEGILAIGLMLLAAPFLIVGAVIGAIFGAFSPEDKGQTPKS